MPRQRHRLQTNVSSRENTLIFYHYRDQMSTSTGRHAMSESNPDGYKREHTFTWLSDEMISDQRLSNIAISTAIGIAFYCDRQRISFPSRNKIANIGRISARSVDPWNQRISNNWIPQENSQEK